MFLLYAVYGRDVKAQIEAPLEQEPLHPGKNTVTYEARLLKALLLKLMWTDTEFSCQINSLSCSYQRVHIPEFESWLLIKSFALSNQLSFSLLSQNQRNVVMKRQNNAWNNYKCLYIRQMSVNNCFSNLDLCLLWYTYINYVEFIDWLNLVPMNLWTCVSLILTPLESINDRSSLGIPFL